MTGFLSSLQKYTAVVVLLLAVSGCKNADNTVKYTLAGAAIGAGTLAIGVAATGGCIPCAAGLGAAIGAGIGLSLDTLENKR
ncbi:MAG: hypothetical protein AB7E52_05300 [Bdellovibrionales bacterium]